MNTFTHESAVKIKFLSNPEQYFHTKVGVTTAVMKSNILCIS